MESVDIIQIKVRGLVFEIADVEKRLVEVTILNGGDNHLPVMEPVLCPNQPMRTVTRVVARLHADTDAAYYHVFFSHDEAEPLNLSLVRVFPASRVKGSVAILRYDEEARVYTSIDGAIERLMAMVCMRR